MYLKHENHFRAPADAVRYGPVPKIFARIERGPRSEKHPIAVVWRSVGTGLFMRGAVVDGKWRPVLWPWVAYTNGKSESVRYMLATEWVARFGGDRGSLGEAP